MCISSRKLQEVVHWKPQLFLNSKPAVVVISVQGWVDDEMDADFAHLTHVQPRRQGVALSPPKQDSKPPIFKHDTINQLRFCHFWSVKAPEETQNPPVENFLATVLPKT